MKPMNYLAGVGLAVGAAYLFDPQRGRSRRVELADRMAGVKRRKLRAIQAALKDAQNRLRGTWFDARATFTNGEVDDPVVEARVRSEIGRKTTHPGAIEVLSNGGTVTLKGDVLEREVEEVVHCVESIKGVKAVANQLTVHSDAGNLPMLQASEREQSSIQMPMRPSTALFVGLAGIGLALFGLARRGTAGTALGVVGLGLVAKGLQDIELPSGRESLAS